MLVSEMQKMPLIAIAYGEIPPNCGPDDAAMLELCDDVAAVLKAQGYRTQHLEIKLNLEETAARIRKMAPDVIFNLVDTIDGKSTLGHLAPLLFEHLGIPYTSGSANAIHLTTEKILSKEWLQKHNLPTPGWLEAGSKPKKSKRTYIVKSVTEDGSVGIDEGCCTDDAAAAASIIVAKQKKHGGRWFAEEYIDGREFNISIMGSREKPKVLPPAEIVFRNYPKGKPKIIGYASKWIEDSFEYNNTPRVFEFGKEDKALLKELHRLTIACWHAFDLTGYARVDFRVAEDGTPYVLEVNVNPCLDRDAGFAAAAERAGYSYENLIGWIVQEAATRHQIELPSHARAS